MAVDKTTTKKKKKAAPPQITCSCCGKPYDEKEFYTSDCLMFRATGRVSCCKSCIEEIYSSFLDKYRLQGYNNPERKAVERVCMAFDIYYNDDVYNTALKQFEAKPNTPFIIWYIKNSRMLQYSSRNYNSTIDEKIKFARENSIDETTALSMHSEVEKNETIEAATKFFGSGFSNEDYLYLYEQYSDWIARHECETKSQEEIFKRLCFTQLELLKATRNKEDTKDLNNTYLKQLEAAKLQPKQHRGETVADTQTFGTLIDKWENTRPIPEVDEELKDVDNIAWYLDVFFKGHLAKMMGLKNGVSNLYTKFIKSFTVEKPEYNDDEDGEALFDALFGNVDIGDD